MTYIFEITPFPATSWNYSLEDLLSDGNILHACPHTGYQNHPYGFLFLPTLHHEIYVQRLLNSAGVICCQVKLDELALVDDFPPAAACTCSTRHSF